MRTLLRELVVFKQRREDEHDRDIANAWTAEKLRRADKVPALTLLLAKREHRQNVKQLGTSLRMLAEEYGLPLTTKKKKGKKKVH